MTVNFTKIDELILFHFNINKTAYQPQVSTTEFLNKKMPRTFFKTSFFLKAYQNLYVKP